MHNGGRNEKYTFRFENISFRFTIVEHFVLRIIAKNKDSLCKSIDNATLFIADEDGNIDANTIFEDMMQMLENISNYEFDFGFVKGRIDGGTLSIDLPDNIITTILFGSKKSISFTKNDFEELKSLVTAE